MENGEGKPMLREVDRHEFRIDPGGGTGCRHYGSSPMACCGTPTDPVHLVEREEAVLSGCHEFQQGPAGWPTNVCSRINGGGACGRAPVDRVHARPIAGAEDSGGGEDTVRSLQTEDLESRTVEVSNTEGTDFRDGKLSVEVSDGPIHVPRADEMERGRPEEPPLSVGNFTVGHISAQVDRVAEAIRGTSVEIARSIVYSGTALVRGVPAKPREGVQVNIAVADWPTVHLIGNPRWMGPLPDRDRGERVVQAHARAAVELGGGHGGPVPDPRVLDEEEERDRVLGEAVRRRGTRSGAPRAVVVLFHEYDGPAEVWGARRMPDASGAMFHLLAGERTVVS